PDTFNLGRGTNPQTSPHFLPEHRIRGFVVGTGFHWAESSACFGHSDEIRRDKRVGIPAKIDPQDYEQRSTR
ncbi:MAG: hypothetical protein KDN05_22905, partial [Verrucomicrobiae bacterium]|nr:hypothetical protein [Verrucomicrobiae bacterium]